MWGGRGAGAGGRGSTGVRGAAGLHVPHGGALGRRGQGGGGICFSRQNFLVQGVARARIAQQELAEGVAHARPPKEERGSGGILLEGKRIGREGAQLVAAKGHGA